MTLAEKYGFIPVTGSEAGHYPAIYASQPSIECVQCQVVYSERVGRLHHERTGHEVMAVQG